MRALPAGSYGYFSPLCAEVFRILKSHTPLEKIALLLIYSERMLLDRLLLGRQYLYKS